MVDSPKLHRPPDQWPLIVAGPMVRRVTASTVAVFIATSKPVTMATLTVYDGVDGDRRPATPQTPGARKTMPLGQKLHVCVVQATGLRLQPGRLYGYDLRLQTASGTTDLAGQGLLSEPVPLGYLPGSLPGVVLPGSIDTLRVIHTSCRRAHGCERPQLTDPDALPLVDRLIEDRRADPSTRPHQLLLTGDQIYFDDVPAALLAAVTSAGKSLLAWGTDERLPDRAGGAITDPAVLAPGARSLLLDAQGVKDRPPDADPAAWTDYAANHVLFFAEWCAMYLFAWSPELWQRAKDVPDAPKHADAPYYYLPPAADVWADSPDTTTPTLIYAQPLAFVRRALANVATYMIFDDHDVTDNWFLDAKVNDQLRGTPLGRRLMRNALAAYTIFQHWGNVPEAFGPGTVGERLLGLLDATSGTPTIGRENHESDADTILDIGAQPVGPDRRSERMRWDYELVFTEHRLIVLDTRTWRAFPAGPRPPSEVEIIDADGQRVVVTLDWGPDGLDGAAEAWAGATADVPRAVATFLQAGADLLSTCAALARIGDARTGAHQGAARATLQAAQRLMDAVGDAPGTASQPSADDWFADAREAIGSSDYAPDVNLVESVLRVATAVNHAVFILREAQAAAFAEQGGAIDDDTLAYLIAVETLAEVLEHAAAFLQGAVHARPRAARHAEELLGAWAVVALDSATALWGADDAQLAADALDAAALAAAPHRAALASAASEFTAAFDPVWALVNDPSRRRPAELISAEALEFQVNERVLDVGSRRPLTLVVSAAPVFGHTLFERLQWVAVQADDSGLGEENMGNEPWSGNQPARARFLDALAPLGSIVLLSGDVHFAFSSVTDYTGNDGERARFVQLTSSSAKNAEARAKELAFLDEQRGRVGDTSLTTPLDFIESLPIQEEWDRMAPEVQALIPSREQVRQALGMERDAAADTAADPAGTWWSDGFDLPGLGTVLDDTGATEWDVLIQDTGTQTQTGLNGVLDGWEDPAGAPTGDQLESSPLAQEFALELGEAVGLDQRGLPELVTTVLRDRRDEVRATDSPGLEARLAARPADRAAIVRTARTTVGHTNIGVVTTRTTAHGRYVAHELHWFPFDALVHQLQPDAFNASFRDDWIITRHCAGLARGTPADGTPIGVCGPGPPPTPEVRLRIDVTSPGQTESGRSRVHVITEAAPTMPDITVEVRGVGMTAAADDALAREVRLECTYAEGNRTDAVYLPGPTDAQWLPLEAGRTTWRPSFPVFCGGQLRVFARANFGGLPITGDTGVGAHLIYGRNPAKADIRAQAHAATNVEVVFHRESRFTQFAFSPAALGPFVEGPAPVLRSASNSFGAGQLDTPPPTIHELWHWRANVDGAVARLNAFRADGLTYQRQVQQGLPWNAATGTLEPPPPDEGVAHPEAPNFSSDQLDLEMWARYNSGRRYHDWDPARAAWVRQPSDSTGVTEYAPELLAMRRRVDAGDFPSDW
jgi:hypothetical protein